MHWDGSRAQSEMETRPPIVGLMCAFKSIVPINSSKSLQPERAQFLVGSESLLALKHAACEVALRLILILQRRASIYLHISSLMGAQMREKNASIAIRNDQNVRPREIT